MREAIDLGHVAVLTAFAASLMVVWVCALAWKWWRTVWGRTSVAISSALVVALFPGVLNVLIHVNTSTLWFAWYRVGSLLVVTGIEVWRAVAIAWAQWRSGDG
jgi:hypothetical protein